MATAAPKRRWTSLIGAGIRMRIARRVPLLNDLDYWKRNTAGIQRGELRNLLRTASGTEFGRQHEFAKLAALDDRQIGEAYQKAVPLAEWYAFKDTIARMREQGERDVLWPGVVRDFAQTSGTTAGDKFIPVTKAMLRSNYLASLDIFANITRFGIPLTRLTGGRILFLGGSSDVATNEHGIRTGDLSGLVTPMIKWPLTAIYSPGSKIALMNHWPSKIDAMARVCLEQDMRMISGMPSWALVLFERVIAIAREQGRSVSTIREIWPNLEIFVHGGVKYGPFDARVRQFWSGGGEDIPKRLELYPASEGFLAIQDKRGDPGLRLNTDMGMFYEFVPLEEIGNENARAFTCDQVEKGQKYVVVMTTCAGMWRYILGDVVEFDSVPARLGAGGGAGDGPARLRIVGRHKHFINAFGENLIGEHIENAVAHAARVSSIVVGEFTAAPIYPEEGQRGAIQLVVEVDGNPGANGIAEAFREAFDAELKNQSVDYGTKRTDSLSMVAPTVTAVPVGTFHRWMESKGKLGGQHKCPRCANHREIIESVLGVVGRS